MLVGCARHCCVCVCCRLRLQLHELRTEIGRLYSFGADVSPVILSTYGIGVPVGASTAASRNITDGGPGAVRMALPANVKPGADAGMACTCTLILAE
jgi:hypothetical protein